MYLGATFLAVSQLSDHAVPYCDPFDPTSIGMAFKALKHTYCVSRRSDPLLYKWVTTSWSSL